MDWGPDLTTEQAENDKRLRNLLMSASRYVQGYAESDRNHPQARESAWQLLRSIKVALNK